MGGSETLNENLLFGLVYAGDGDRDGDGEGRDILL